MTRTHQATADLATTTEPTGLADRMRYAQALAGADLLPAAYRKRPADLLLALEYGDALGLPLAAVLTGVHIIEGKPTASAALLAALVRRAGHRLRVTGDDHQATAELVRHDDAGYVFRSTWTIDRARTAGLAGRGTWAKHPRSMLVARAVSEVVRDGAPEVGILYTADELDHADQAAAPWPDPAPAGVDVATGELPADPELVDVVDAELVDDAGGPADPADPPAHDPARVTRTRRAEPDPADPWASEPPADLEQAPEPQPTRPRALKMISPAQQRMIGALARKHSLDRADLLDLARATLDLPALGSATELDQGEASQLIDALNALPAPEQVTP